MVATVPVVTNWSVTPQNGQVDYFTLMNTWLFESTSVIDSLNTAINKINEAGQDINNIGANAISAITLDTVEDLATYSGTGLVIVKEDGLNYIYESSQWICKEWKTVYSIAELEGLDVFIYSKAKLVLDGRSGDFIYNATQSAVNNGGTIFDGWVRQFNGAVNVKWFGAKGDFVTDDSEAFLSVKSYMSTLKNGTGDLDNQIAGFKLIIPYGVYTITKKINFDLFMHYTIEGNMAEIYYSGTALPDGEYAVTFSNSSWFAINSLYLYCSFQIINSYRVSIRNIKCQSKYNFNNLWNFEATSCWFYYANGLIKGGHNHNYNSCAFEFGTSGVTIKSPDNYNFNYCYTEDIQETFKLILDDSGDRMGPLTFNNCFLDVQKQGSVYYVAGKPFFNAVDSRTVKTPILAPIIFNNCEWHSAGMEPPFNALGCLITASDTFYNIQVLKSSTRWGFDYRTLSSLGYSSIDSPEKTDRIFKGVGIYLDEMNIPTKNPLKNGDFVYPILQKSDIDIVDLYREDNLGWWGQSADGSGNATFGANGSGRVQLNSGSDMLIHIPVNNPTEKPNWLANNYSYFFELGTYYNEGVISINAVRGIGASKVVGESLLIDGYPTKTVNSSAYNRIFTTAFSIPRDVTITYVQIKIDTTGIGFLSVGSAKIRKSGSNPSNWFPILESY